MNDIKLKNKQIQKSYDDFIYTSSAYHVSSPIRLEVVGFLFGLKTMPLKNARVLEIGCAMGGNLLPFALKYPNSNCVGIDLSKEHITRGNQYIKALNLTNIKLIHEDIIDIKKDFGEFDYIICHGVFSWVPKEIKQAIMNICKTNLSKHGLCYISYNTYPAWKGKEILRDLILFRCKDEKNPHTKIGLAKGAIEFLHQNTTPTYLKTLTDTYLEEVTKTSPSYLIHEYFEENNSPNYFHEVVNLAKENELCYVAEANYSSNYIINISEQSISDIAKETNNDRIQNEQYFDFMQNRSFRNSIFTHQSFENDIFYKVHFLHEKLDKFHIAGFYEYDEKNQTYKFQQQSLTNQLFQSLNEAFPSSIHISEFRQKFSHDENIKQALYIEIANLIARELCEVYLEKQAFSSKIQTYPKTFAYIQTIAKYMIENDDFYSINFFNLKHQNFTLDTKLDSYVILFCDGKNTKENIYEKILKEAKKGNITLYLNNNEIKNEEQIKQIIKEKVDATLYYLGVYAMFE